MRGRYYRIVTGCGPNARSATAFGYNDFAGRRQPLLFQSDAVVADQKRARLCRADSLQSARRHLWVYRPDAVMIDLGLPDGPGEDFPKGTNIQTK